MAPASPAIAAALRLGDAGATRGGHLAQSLQHLREAESLPVVCGETGEALNGHDTHHKDNHVHGVHICDNATAPC